MFLVTPLLAKVASGVLASTLLVAGGATVLARQGGGESSARSAGVGAEGTDVSAGADDTVIVIDPVTGARRVVKKTSAEAKAAAAASGLSASGEASSGGLSASGQAGSAGSGGGETVSVDGGGAPIGPGGPDGSGPGGTDPGAGADPSYPSVPNLGVPVPAAPSAPGAPEAPSFDHGSYSVVVPGTPAVSKRLCLSGMVNRCKTVSVPAASPVTLTVAYSANTSAQPPTFTPNRCSGGLSLTVAGLSSGADVTADAQGNQVAASVSESGPTQTASLCDA